jgi:hypothetical protein
LGSDVVKAALALEHTDVGTPLSPPELLPDEDEPEPLELPPEDPPPLPELPPEPPPEDDAPPLPELLPEDDATALPELLPEDDAAAPLELPPSSPLPLSSGPAAVVWSAPQPARR